jgi:hypothetical protein
MSKIAVRFADVAHGQKIQLLLASAALFMSGWGVHAIDQPAYRSVDGEEDGPCDEAAQEAENNDELEVAHEQEAVNGRVVQNVLVGRAAEVADPSQERGAGRWGLAPVRAGQLQILLPMRRRWILFIWCDVLFSQAVEVGSGGVDAAEFVAEDQEEGDEDDGDDGGGNEGGDEAGERIGLVVFVAMAARLRLLLYFDMRC